MADSMFKVKTIRKWSALAMAVLVMTVAVESALRYKAHHAAYFGLYHDDGLYLVTSRALAEDSGYRIISLPGCPLQTKYPVLYPFLLSLLWRLHPHFPDNLPMLESSGLVLGFLFAVLSCLYLLNTRRCTPFMAAAILGATVLNIRFLSFLPLTMSDFLYGSLSVIALWNAETAARSNRKNVRYVHSLATGVSAGLSGLTRSVGTAIGPLTLVFLLRAKRFGAAALAAFTFVAVMAPFWWWQTSSSTHLPVWISYYTDYAGWMADAYKQVGAADLLWRKVNDVFVAVPKIVCPLVDVVPYAELNPWQFFLFYRIGFFLFWIVVILGLLRDLRHSKWNLLPAYFSVYWVSMLVWPGLVEWRLVLVVLPFFYYFVFCAMRIVVGLLKRVVLPTGQTAFNLVRGALIVTLSSYLLIGSAAVSVPHAGRYPKLLPSLFLTNEQEQHDITESYQWIRSNTKDTDVFVCSNDPVLFLYTGRHAVQPSPYQGWRLFKRELVTKESVLDAIRGSHASYVMLDPSFGGAYAAHFQFGQSIVQLVNGPNALLKPIYVSPHGVVSIFRVNQVQ